LISFRYHLVSIVAVFLALAVGIVMGTTVIQQGLVDSLRSETNRAINSNHALQAEISQLLLTVDTWKKVGDEIEQPLVSEQLPGAGIVVITQVGVDLGVVNGVQTVLKDAGAKVVAVLEVTGRMALPDAGSQSDLAGLLGLAPTEAPEALAEQAGRQLGTRLANGPSSTGTDLIDELVQGNGTVAGGFLTVQPGPGTTGSAAIGGANQTVVVISGGRQQPQIDPSAFLAPLVEQMVKDLHPVAAVESSTTVFPFVSSLRTNPAVEGHIVTVDDGDQMYGRVALVFGLHDMLASPGHGGDYGTRDDASDIIPGRPPPP
jgi:hypothetical protein